MIVETLACLILMAGAWGLSVTVFARDKNGYDVTQDYAYALEPDWSVSCRLDSNRLQLDAIPPADFTLILPIRVISSRRFSDPLIRIQVGEQQVTYYFERGAKGLRYVDITQLADGIGRRSPIRVEIKGCQCGVEQLLAFARPALEKMRLLIIAPHPDDAELAAYGLYETYASQASILIVSPGERLGELKRQYIRGLDSDLVTATRRKADIRLWDGHCVPRWAGVSAEESIALGYFDGTLERMQQHPDEVISHPVLTGVTPVLFRRFNTVELPSDDKVQNRWRDLVNDIVYILEAKTPDVIVMPHPQLDVHPDHAAVTAAVMEAAEQSTHAVQHKMFYVNHARGARQFPSGPAGAATGLVPNVGPNILGSKVYSVPLDAEARRRKACALGFMHDLTHPYRPIKQLKTLLARMLRWRSREVYGADTYFRTALRDSELFLYIAEQNLPEDHGPSRAES